MNSNEGNEDAILANALAGFTSPELKEAFVKEFPSTKETAKKKQVQYKIFSSSILICYLQGDASPLFMQSSTETFLSMFEASDTEIKEFLKPLFALLHDNKNLIFRPINKHMIQAENQETFNKLLESFRKETRLESFLANYKSFLSFLSSCYIPVKKENIFTSLSELLLLIADYREHTTSASVKEFPLVLSSSDIEDLSF